jgi:hypothetical protein
MEIRDQDLKGVNFHTTSIFLSAGPATIEETDLIED